MTRDADALGKSGHGTPSPSLPTPGPWRVNSFAGPNLQCCGAGVADVYTGEGSTAESVARVAYREKRGDFGSRGEQEANARLIAAAPDMLVALTKAAETFSDFARTLRLLRHGIIADAALIAEDATRAAIAKATGQP